MTATLTAPSAHTTAGGTGRILHAFPPNANVSLCGRILRDQQTTGHGPTRHCAECMETAAHSNPTRR